MRQQPYEALQLSSPAPPPPPRFAQHVYLVLITLMMALITLACAFIKSTTQPTASHIARLPTLTSTPKPFSGLAAASTPSGIETPPPVLTPTEMALPTPYTGGWVFFGVRNFFDQNEGGLRLYGDALNDSSASLEVTNITGAFYDELGQTVADGNTTGVWPVAVIPPGGRVPFELTVPGLQSPDSFDLRIEAQPSSQTPRQDFDFLEVSPSTEGSNYCLAGKLSNPGEALASYLVIAAVLFDDQDKVITYADNHEPALKDLGSGQTKVFKICADPFNQMVARYELRAWGL